MKSNKYKYFIISVVFWMTLIVYLHKTLGYRHVANLYATDPLSWDEIINNIPIYFIGSIVMTVIIYFIYKTAQKDKEKREEEARKRIEARKKITKEKKSKKSESDKEEKQVN